MNLSIALSHYSTHNANKKLLFTVLTTIVLDFIVEEPRASVVFPE